MHRRLQRLGAGVRFDYDRTSVDELGAAILKHLGQPVRHGPVPADGTAKAARMIAELLA